MKRYLYIIYIFLLTLLSLKVSAAGQPEFYKRWLQYDNNFLMQKSREFVNNPAKNDSALVCLSIIANRYETDGSGKDYIINAYVGLWYLYFLCYYDYTKASDCLMKAEHVAQEQHQAVARIYLNYGVMYETLSTQTGDKAMNRLALSYYRKAIDTAVQTHDVSAMQNAFSNMALVAYDEGNMKTVPAYWKKYNQVVDDKTPETLFNRALYRALSLMAAGQGYKAVEVLQKEYQGLPTTPAYQRFRFTNLSLTSEALQVEGAISEAISKGEEALVFARARQMKDAQLEMLDKLSHLYKQQGNTQQSQQKLFDYYCLKDTLMNYQQLAGLSKMRFLNEMQAIDKKLQDAQRDKQRQQVISIIISVATVIVLILLIIVYRRNRELNQSYRYLYEKSREQRRQYEEERKQRAAKAKAVSAEKKEKYQGSSLESEQKDSLLQRIRDVMDTTEEIYSPDFTLGRLAELTASNLRYVSQVINETGANFSAFLNEYRIRRACTLMDDQEHYGSLTLEAISAEVGFKSRSTFIIAFKRFTGLTPSAYLNQAKEQK